MFTWEQGFLTSEESKFVSLRQIIEDEALNYRPTVYKRSVKMPEQIYNEDDEAEDDNVYVEFKKKKLIYHGKKSHLITMTDITASLKYSKVRERVDLLNSLQASVSHDMKAPLDAIAKTMIKVIKQRKII